MKLYYSKELEIGKIYQYKYKSTFSNEYYNNHFLFLGATMKGKYLCFNFLWIEQSKNKDFGSAYGVMIEKI